MKRDSFVFYRSFYEATRDLDDENFNNTMRAVINYALDGTINDDMSPIAKVVFTLIKPQIDANNKRFVNGCKGAKYGALGGAKKGNQNAKKQPQNNPKTTPNVNVNDNDNVNDNENDKCKCMNDKEKDISPIHSQMIRLMRM